MLQLMTTYLLAQFAGLSTRLHDDEEGATAVEYGLMVALIAIVIITAVGLIGTNLSDVFNDTAGKLTGLPSGG